MTSWPPSSILLRIKRQDHPSSLPYWQTFAIPYQPHLNVTACLQYIAENPRTADGQPTTPVAWEASCLEETCGACTMLINGQARQACSTLIDPILRQAPDRPIELAPLSKFPLVRDLIVDRSRMFDNLIAVKAWVPIDGTRHTGFGPPETQALQELRYALSRCMTCGCCLEACPQFLLNNSFQGAQVWSQVLYFNLHATASTLADQRLQAISGPGGLPDCGNAQNCLRVCPKELPLAQVIATLGRQLTSYSFRRFFATP